MCLEIILKLLLVGKYDAPHRIQRTGNFGRRKHFWNPLFHWCCAKELDIPIYILGSSNFSRSAKLGIRIKMILQVVVIIVDTEARRITTFHVEAEI